jgi:hypothetical protein
MILVLAVSSSVQSSGEDCTPYLAGAMNLELASLNGSVLLL